MVLLFVPLSTAASAKQEAQVILSQPAQRLHVPPHGALKHQLLLLLQLQDTLLNGAPDDEAHHCDGLVLPQAVDTVLGLLLHRGVPPRVHQHHMAGDCEVERHPSGLEAHQEDANLWVRGELRNDPLPHVHAHASLQLDALDANLLQAVLHQVQHARELAEHEGLAGRVAIHHAVKLLTQRLNLGTGLEGRQVDAGQDAVLLGRPAACCLGGLLRHGRRRAWWCRQVHREGLGAGGALRCACGTLDILHDACAAEGVPAGRRDRVLHVLVAHPTHRHLRHTPGSVPAG
mmetsp:Transcript_32898/g.72651  ORF Transcript_32898/g.72651 Transcript_32898/m.72651 type:complete len:288 (+) Transcript_32898:313-1176(+)